VESFFFDGNSSGNFDPKRYEDGALAGRLAFFLENFDDNDNDWFVDNDSDSRSEILDGLYIIQSKTASSFVYSIPVGLDLSKDFELEASLRIYEAPNEFRNGLVWGGSTGPLKFNCMAFNISRKMWIGDYDGDVQTYTPWLDWSLAGSLTSPDSYNKLTVRKVGSAYYFFVNETYFGEYPAGGFEGSNVGFIVGSNSVLYIDFVRVDYLLL
jgi:hypothetical protein